MVFMMVTSKLLKHLVIVAIDCWLAVWTTSKNSTLCVNATHSKTDDLPDVRARPTSSADHRHQYIPAPITHRHCGLFPVFYIRFEGLRWLQLNFNSGLSH